MTMKAIYKKACLLQQKPSNVNFGQTWNEENRVSRRGLLMKIWFPETVR